MPTSFWQQTHATRQLEFFEPFVGLTREQSVLLRSRLQKCSFAAGDRFIRAGDLDDALYLIADGTAEVRRPDGVALARLGKGHFVGEMALLNREPRNADVIAVTKLRAWRLGHEDFEMLASQLPELKLFLTRLIAHRLHWSGRDLLSRRIGRYEVIERIGEGGMGWVFRAVQLPEETEVAIKMLPHTLVTRYGFLERFRAEAHILSRLRHENIVSVLETIEAYGTMFIVMEFVRGLTAREWIARARDVPYHQVRAIAYAISKALQHAHKQGVVHRDVKPENIMIREDGCVKLMDFGIAQQLDRASTHGAAFTPQYAAPESLRGDRVTPAADFYSLGVTLYELITGRLPFVGTTMSEWTQLHAEQAPRPLRDFAPRVPADIEELVNAALLKEPQQRSQTLAPLLTKLGPRVLAMTPPPRVSVRSRVTPLFVLWLRMAGEKHERAVLLDRPLVIGRSDRSDVPLSDPSVSARHCMLHAAPDGIHIRDLDSRNGTFVNNRRVLKSPVHAGDRVRLGLTLLTFDQVSRSGLHVSVSNLTPARTSVASAN